MRKLPPQGTQVTDSQRGVPTQSLLQREVALVYIRVLEVLVEIRGGGCARGTGRNNQLWKRGGPRSRGAVESVGHLADGVNAVSPKGGVAGCSQRAIDRGIDHATIEHTGAPSQRCLAVSKNVHRETHARCKVVLVRVKRRGQRQSRVDQRGIRGRQRLIVVARPKGKAQSRQYLPLVLGKEAVVPGSELESQWPECLTERGVVLLIRRGRNARRSRIGLGLVEVGEVACQAAVAVSAVLRAEVLGEVVGVQDIHAELNVVIAPVVVHRVGDLPAALIGVPGALQEGRRTEGGGVGDRDRGRQAKRIDVAGGGLAEVVLFVWGRYLRDLVLEVTPILVADLVEQPIADGCVELGNAEC